MDLYYPEGFFETTLSADLTASATTVSVTAVPSRVTKGYMIIEPSSSTKREVIHFTSVGTGTVTAADDTNDSNDATGRGCTGSVTVGANTAHDQGVTVLIAASENYWKRLYDLLVGEDSGLTFHSPSFKGDISGWIADTDTWVYVSPDSFKVVGKDVTAKFPKGTKIKLTQTTAKYFYVTAASFSTDTTVTITGGTAWEYSLANAAITSPYYSYMATPQGFPEEGLNYTPTISTTADCGTLSLCRAQINNNQVVFKGRITYAKALASGNLTLSLPVNCIYSLIPIGFAHYFDSGVADKRAFVNTPSTSTINFYLTDGNSNFTGTFVNSSNWSSGDVVDWICSYPWIA